jgi:hypothetical protein
MPSPGGGGGLKIVTSSSAHQGMGAPGAHAYVPPKLSTRGGNQIGGFGGKKKIQGNYTRKSKK